MPLTDTSTLFARFAVVARSKENVYPTPLATRTLGCGEV